MTDTEAQNRPEQQDEAAPVIIAGAGLAALTCALQLAPRKVLILSPAPLGEGAASDWAQGGIAAAVGDDDDPSLHLEDTLIAGAGLVDEPAASFLTEHAEEAIRFLVECGVDFDRDREGNLSLGKEGAHSRNRILHAGGDATGHAIMQVLIKTARMAPHIDILEQTRLTGIHSTSTDGHIHAVQISDADTTRVLPCAALVLATGGIGGLYARTTSPAQVCGEGHALAALAGARLADMEFVQFHPTAMDFEEQAPDGSTPLATEALRGQGAILVNDRGERFMKGVHEDAELAPRDVVARAIFREMAVGRRVFLDCRQAIGPSFADTFPTVTAAARAHGIDPAVDLLPVSPATHYHMGGVATDQHGRTSLHGLWACGEVACTGVHGANRLASNSLLEALVMGNRVAKDIAGTPLATPATDLPPAIPRTPGDTAAARALRDLMFRQVGLIRDENGLLIALSMTDKLRRKSMGTDLELKAITAQMIVYGALKREESRGGHFRSDFPATDATAHRSFRTLDEVLSGTEETFKQHSIEQVFPA